MLGVDPDRAERIVDPALAESALAAPFAGFAAHERDPTVEERTAVLVERLARKPPVRADGDTRSAFAMAVLFAERNGRVWRSEDSDRDAAVVEALAAGRATHADALAWVRARTRPARRS